MGRVARIGTNAEVEGQARARQGVGGAGAGVLPILVVAAAWPGVGSALGCNTLKIPFFKIVEIQFIESIL